jgi:ABC-type sugar transport system ATPase subunit
MATIELQDVSKIFSRQAFESGAHVNRLAMSKQADKAFAERVISQAEAERDTRQSQSSKIVALDHISLTIPNGQTLAVVGPSGCGKSTLLRVVAGLEGDFSGKVLFDGVDMQTVPVKDRYIGMVFQSYALYPHFKGQGNLGFFFKVHKIDDKETQERIRITSEIMGIGFDTLLERKPGTLSGGQQQRVAIGRAIVRNPQLFLFDEPLSNLDAKLRVQTRLEIKRLLHRFQITSIYVTHDQVEAIALSDLIAIMRAGRVEQMGDYATLRDRPATSFVAGFLGTPPMNLLASGAIADGALRLGEHSFPLPDSLSGQVQSSQAITLGIRPEAVQLISSSSTTVTRPAGAGVHLRGQVEMVEPDFAHQAQVVYVRSGDGPAAITFAVTTELDAAITGATVDVVFPHDQLYFFDTASERRLEIGDERFQR